jgi:sugar lactone lactonase YvrE
VTSGADGWPIGLATIVTVAIAVSASGQVAPPPEGAPMTPALRRLIDGRGDVERVVTGFQNADGIAWGPGEVLIFTDPVPQQILQWTFKDGVKVRRESSGGAAGVAIDLDGRLLAAERATGHVTRIDDAGSAVVIADVANGKPIGTATDLAVARDKSIYVTSYAGEEGRVVRIDPTGQVAIIAADLLRPSGIGFAPDDKTLYVSDYARSEVRAYPRQPDGSLGTPRRLAVILPWKRGVQGRPNGLTVDLRGRLYLAGPGGIWVLDANGGRLGVIATPETPSACTFGDADGRTLYIAAERSVYKVRLKVTDGR